MNMIKNLDDIRYRKLWLRSEIFVIENKIKSQLSELKNNIESVDLKSDIVKSIINHPAVFFNTARITYDFIKKWKAKRQRKSKRRN